MDTPITPLQQDKYNLIQMYSLWSQSLSLSFLYTKTVDTDVLMHIFNNTPGSSEMCSGVLIRCYDFQWKRIFVPLTSHRCHLTLQSLGGIQRTSKTVVHQVGSYLIASHRFNWWNILWLCANYHFSIPKIKWSLQRFCLLLHTILWLKPLYVNDRTNYSCDFPPWLVSAGISYIRCNPVGTYTIFVYVLFFCSTYPEQTPRTLQVCWESELLQIRFEDISAFVSFYQQSSTVYSI